MIYYTYKNNFWRRFGGYIMKIKLYAPVYVKTFRKYLKKYSLVFVVPFLLCCCITLISFQNLRAYSRQVSELQLRENIVAYSDVFSSMIYTSQLFHQHEDFVSLSRISSPMPISKALTLKNSNELLRQTAFINNYSPYLFSLFNSNDIFVSSAHCSSDFLSYYPKFMSIQLNGQSLSAAEVTEFLFSASAETKPIAFYTTDAFYATTSTGTATCITNAILCIINGNGTEVVPSYITVFVLDPNTIVSSILPASLTDYASVRITDISTGRELLNHLPTTSGQNCVFFEYDMDSYLSVTVGIPHSVIAKPMMSILFMLGLFILVLLIFTLVSTILLSYQEQKRIMTLFAALPTSLVPAQSRDSEYTILAQLIHNICIDTQNYLNQTTLLSAQNQAFLLENLIIRGVSTPEENRMLEQFLPSHANIFCVALLRTHTASEEIYTSSSLMVKEYIQTLYPNQFIHVHTTLHDDLYLFAPSSNTAFCLDQLSDNFAHIINALSDHEKTFFNVTISSVCTVASDIRLCYTQAHQTMQLYASPCENLIENYNIRISTLQRNIITIDFLSHLYNLLLSASRQAIQDQFSLLKNAYILDSHLYDSQRQQIFYSLRNVLHNAKLCISPAIADKISLPHYSNRPLPQLLQSLEDISLLFCDCIEETRRSHNSKMKNNILEYIQSHYADIALTPSMVCKEFNISDKYLFQFIKDQIGSTYSEYVEKLRIKKAKEYLTETAYSNEQIASLVGFGSTTTFYRAFNRQTGISPGAYKESHRNL